MFYPIINRIIAIGVFNLVAFTYGDKNADLNVKSSQVSTRDVPSKDLVIEEGDIYAFILKNDYEDDSKCKERLEEYCKELKEIDPELEKVHTKIKEICGDNDKEKCKEIKEKIIKVIDEFNSKKYTQMDYFKVYEHCDNIFPKCFFYSGINSTNITDNCNYLRYLCYSQEYEKLKTEIMLKAVGFNDNYTDFRIKAKEVCPILIQHGNDLIIDCLKIGNLFKNYLRNYVNHFCNSLNAVLNDNKLKEKCHERLEKCYFFKDNCDKCDELKESCKKKNITYSPPREDFSPIESEETLLKRIDLENFYKRARNKGLADGNLKRTLHDMLIYLSAMKKSLNETECRRVLKEDCDFFESLTPEFKELCQDEKKKEEKCKDILDVTNRCEKLKMMLYINRFSTEFNNDKPSKIIPWEELSTSFNEKECLEYTSECYLMRVACNNSIVSACRNLILACYKRKQDLLFIESIESQLLQKKYELSSDEEKLKICQKVVLENCLALGNNNNRNFPGCLRPKELCSKFEDTLLNQSKQLGQALDEVRDSPKEKDCIKLGKDCEGILGNSDSNNEKCAALKKNCEYLGVAKELKNEFLKEKNDALANVENCVKALKRKCDGLFKEEEDPLRISCGLPEETCKFMVSEVEGHCNVFKNNIEKQSIINKTKDSNETLKKETCILWDAYCDQLMRNCPDELKEGENIDGKGVCSQLKLNCVSIINRLQLENTLAYKLKGNLSTEKECEEALGRYCAQLKKGHRLSSLCNDGSKQKNGSNGVCEELVKKVKERCPFLKSNLQEAKIELKRKKDEYENLKEEIKKSTKEAKLVLSKLNEDGQGAASDVENSTASGSEVPAGSGAPAGTPSTPSGVVDTGDETMKVSIVKRTFIDSGVSIQEINLFDTTARALELYLELKEDCEDLLSDTSFTKECPESETVYKEIIKLCQEVKELEVTTLDILSSTTTSTKMTTETATTTKMTTETVTTMKMITETVTTTKAMTITTMTSTTTESVDGEKVPEQCTFVQTTDTWVTSTSLHKSTTTSTSTITSTVTLTSIRKCKPTKCTTDSSKETQEEEEDVKPNEAVNIRASAMLKMMFFGMIIMGIL